MQNYIQNQKLYTATSNSAMNYLVLVYVAYIGMMALKKIQWSGEFGFWFLAYDMPFLPFPLS
jgi:hypothetical protein